MTSLIDTKHRNHSFFHSVQQKPARARGFAALTLRSMLQYWSAAAMPRLCTHHSLQQLVIHHPSTFVCIQIMMSKWSVAVCTFISRRDNSFAIRSLYLVSCIGTHRCKSYAGTEAERERERTACTERRGTTNCCFNF